MKKILILVNALVICANMFAQKQMQAVEGNEGIWIYFSKEVVGSSNKEDIRSATILRADGTGSFKEIGTVKAITNAQEANQLFGDGFMTDIRSALNKSSDAEVFDYISKNPSLDEYGLLPLDPYFMQSMGAAFLDKQKPATGSKVKYRVQLKRGDGSVVREAEDELTIGIRPKFGKISVASIVEGDSLVSVVWNAKQNSNNPFYFATVYRQAGSKSGYVKVGTVMSNWKSDTTSFVWTESVVPGNVYRFYIIPTNITGFESDQTSDTATTVAADFNRTPLLENFVAKDSTSGIHFSWKPQPQNLLYSGLAVYRKPLHVEDFVAIDTIPFTASEYVDVKVIANVLYQYQFRPVNIRFITLPPSAQATAMHRNNLENNLPPVALAAIPEKNGVRVLWQAVKHYDVNGYYVYRSVDGEEYKLQSLLVKDTFFFDEGATNGRSQYNYKITSLNFNDDQSDYSNTVQAQPVNTVAPIAPKAVSAYTESGRITLEWQDMKQQDDFVAGYNVYRKEGAQNFGKFFTAAELRSNDFRKLNTEPLEANTYSDRTAENGKTYVYAITSVDANGLESNAEQLVDVESAKQRLAAPSFFNLSKNSGGVQLSWNEELNKSVTQYVIYRRARNANDLQQVGTVNASQQSYTDNTAQQGTFYFYAIKARGTGGAESDFSIEKGIIR